MKELDQLEGWISRQKLKECSEEEQVKGGEGHA